MHRSSVLFVLVCCAPVFAQESRDVRPIRTPASAALADARQLPRALVEAAAKTVLEAYNTAEFEQVLAADFYDRWRLTDAITEQVPRDARMRLLSLQAWQLFDQTRGDGGSGPMLTSLVSATVNVQLEFTAADGRFERRSGVTELILRIHQPGGPSP